MIEATTKEKLLSEDLKSVNKVVPIRTNTLDQSQILNVNESIELAKQIRTDLCDDITEIAMEQLLAFFGAYGIFSDTNRYNARDVIMVENAIASALHRYYGLEHPLQEVTDDVFRFDDIDDDDE